MDEAQIASGLAAAGAAAAKAFITTKIPCTGYARAKANIATNLRQLKVKAVDLTLIHIPYGLLCNIKATWRALVEAKTAGQTRAIGVSNFGIDQLKQLEPKPSLNQCSLSVVHHDDATIQYCQDNGIVYEAYSPLCGGANGSSCSEMGGKSVLRVPEVQQIAQAHRVSPAQIGLKWIVQQGHPLACASWREDYMKEDLDLWSWGNLTEGEMNTLSAVAHKAASA